MLTYLSLSDTLSLLAHAALLPGAYQFESRAFFSVISESRQEETRARGDKRDEKNAQPLRLYHESKGGNMVDDTPRANKRSKKNEMPPEITPAKSAKRSRRRHSQDLV